MRFRFYYYTPSRKQFAVVAEMIEASEDFETWKIFQKDTPDSFILVKSDRPQQVKAERFNWTLNGRPVTDYHTKGIISMIEWRQYFTINDGYAGVHVKDDF